eukprot:scaffold229_cov157-Skeletonema_menzelii.AAC.1
MAGIVGKLKKLDCDGEYDGVSSHITDGVSLLRLAHSRHERNRVAKKQSKAPRQASVVLPFFSPRTSSKLELDLNSQLSRAKQSYPVISKKFLSVRPSVRPFVMHKNQT